MTKDNGEDVHQRGVCELCQRDVDDYVEKLLFVAKRKEK